MTIQPATKSFLQVLSSSQLLTPAQMIKLHEGLGNAPPESRTATEIADWLIEQQMITRWQADKLLQAKHRGFFLGPYKLLRRIARGGMSTIYAAQHLETGEDRALKVLSAARVGKASYLPRFFREGDIARRLQHPNIVRVFGAHSATDGRDEVHFLAMELLSGRDLSDLVKADGPLPCRTAAEYIRQAATGLQYAHSAGLVHRDVKPGNLFLTDDNTIRLVDLGLAQDSEDGESLTREYNEKVLGTADYLAPEQATDSHTADARADIYGLGCTFYFLLTGKPPCSHGSLMQRIVAQQNNTPDLLSSIRDDVPTELSSLLMKMMAKNRDDRIQTAFEVAAKLRDWLKRTAGQKEFDAPPHLINSVDSVVTLPVTRNQILPEQTSGSDSSSVHGWNSGSAAPPAEDLQHFLHVLEFDTDGKASGRANVFNGIAKAGQRIAAVRGILLVVLGLLMYPAGIMTAVFWPDLTPTIQEWLRKLPSVESTLQQESPGP